MKIEIVTPAVAGSQSGNRVTALRWQRLLDELGHAVAVTQAWSGEPVDVLVALHARKSATSVRRFRASRADGVLVLALTGTDLYGDVATSEEARASIDAADALVVLQPRGIHVLPDHARRQTHVVLQSVPELPAAAAPIDDGTLDVLMLAHLRAVKDPFLAAEAVRLLPGDSAVSVTHLGAPLEEGAAQRAQAETASNPRYRWMGPVPREEALRYLVRAHALLVTSRLEGGANVVSEALAAGVPVLSTRIDGSIGLLGEDYPGYFAPGDAGALAALLRRVETDTELLADLRRHVSARRHLVDPAHERESWRALLASVRPEEAAAP